MYPQSEIGQLLLPNQREHPRSFLHSRPHNLSCNSARCACGPSTRTPLPSTQSSVRRCSSRKGNSLAVQSRGFPDFLIFVRILSNASPCIFGVRAELSSRQIRWNGWKSPIKSNLLLITAYVKHDIITNHENSAYPCDGPRPEPSLLRKGVLPLRTRGVLLLWR